MAKTLCDWSKTEIERQPSKLAAIISAPTFYCRKCARAAVSERYLCKPCSLPEIPPPAETQSVP